VTLCVRPGRWACVAGLLWCFAAGAHVYAAKTLHGLVAESDLVLRARINAVDPGPLRSTEPTGISRPAVAATVLEVLKGELDGPLVRFVQHGHGVARFEPGEDTLLFLVRIERNRELAVLGQTGAFEWVSLQEHSDEYSVEAPTRDRLLAAVRGYVEAGAAASPAESVPALRRATLELLESGDAKLAACALRDLAAAPGVPLITKADLPALLAIEGDPQVSMGVRIALLAELERRGLVTGAPHWKALLSGSIPTPDRVTAIRAAGVSGGPTARAQLIALLADPDERVAAAAAAALGAPNNSDAVAPLAATLSSHESASVRLAAIRGLGRIDSPGARDALSHAAESHSDPATQRRAIAELRKARAAGGAVSATQ
jgi:hypothetical protein